MRRFLGVLALVLVGAISPLQAAPDEVGLDSPFSTKIWDDFSVANLSAKAHQALGYATVTLGVSAFVLDQRQGSESVFVGQAAAAAAATTVLAGLVSHWDKLTFEGELLTWHNLHASTAAAGASLVLAAPFLPGSSRWGLAGTLLLVLAIVWEG